MSCLINLEQQVRLSQWYAVPIRKPERHADEQHGVKRARISPQAAEAKRQKEQAKLELYSRLQQEVMAKVRCRSRLLSREADRAQKQAKEYTLEALQATNNLLDLNPEYYTIWNYRRHILVKGIFPVS